MVLGAAVDLAQFVVEQAAAQRAVGHHLIAGIHRYHHVQAAGGGLGAVLGGHQLAHGFGHVFGVHGGVGGLAQVQRLLARGLGLLFGDEAIGFHAVDDVLLAPCRALGVADRVVG